MANNITEELEWVESRLADIKADVDANPYTQVKDRTTTKTDRYGNTYEEVIQKKEIIKESLRKSLKEYMSMMDQLNKLREEEKRKEIEARGGAKLNSRMKELTNKQQ